MSSDARAPYLLVKHSEGWNVDRCSRWLEGEGVPIEYRYPVSGDAFPDPEGYAGVIVFGGRWSANDAHAEDWVLPEQRFIERCLATGTPYFGVCLGAQMLAHVLGAQVDSHPDGLREVGFHEILPTPDGQEFLAAPLHVMQWHTEGFTLPSGCTRIAAGHVFENQAFRVDADTVGVQFHPEVCPAVLSIWQERNRQRKPDDLSDAERARHARDARRHDPAITDWLDGFLAGWTGRAARAA